MILFFFFLFEQGKKPQKVNKVVAKKKTGKPTLKKANAKDGSGKGESTTTSSQTDKKQNVKNKQNANNNSKNKKN